MTTNIASPIRIFDYFKRRTTGNTWGVALFCTCISLLVVYTFLFYLFTTPAELGLIRLSLTPCILLLGVVVFLLTGQSAPLSRVDGSETATRAWMISGSLWILFVPLWTSLLDFGGPPNLAWSLWPYLDKRWLIAVYWISVLSVTVLPLFIQGVLIVSNRAPRTWKALGLAVSDLQTAGHQSSPYEPSTRTLAARVVFGLVLATLLYGPPWNIDNLALPIGDHEALHLSGLQAISQGYTPYVGPASNNYGPGMQLFTYAYMKASSQLSLPGFRESYAAALWISLLIVYALIFSSLRLIPALLAALLMLVLSPLVLWRWTPEGILNGFFGWSNTLRTVGTLLLALVFSNVAFLRASNYRLIAANVGIGLLWGMLAYYSQENLLGGLITLGLLLAILYLTGTFTFQRAFTTFSSIAAGFLVVWLPIILFYLSQDSFGAFRHHYFLVPSRFLRGYANTAYRNGLADGLGVAYYTLPFIVTLLAVLPIYRFGPARVASPMCKDRFLIVAVSTAFLTAYTSSMLRADYWHLVSTLFPLSVVIAVALFYLPRLISKHPVRRWVVRLTTVLLAANVFFPTWLSAPKKVKVFARCRLESFSVSKKVFDPDKPIDEMIRRYGPSLSTEPAIQETMALMNEVKKIVKNDPTFVSLFAPLENPDKPRSHNGDFYFLSDLNPGPVWIERSDMVADSNDLIQFMAHFQNDIDRFDHIVSSEPDSREVAIFKEAYPDCMQQVIRHPRASVYVYSKR